MQNDNSTYTYTQSNPITLVLRDKFDSLWLINFATIGPIKFSKQHRPADSKDPDLWDMYFGDLGGNDYHIVLNQNPEDIIRELMGV